MRNHARANAVGLARPTLAGRLARTVGRLGAAMMAYFTDSRFIAFVFDYVFYYPFLMAYV